MPIQALPSQVHVVAQGVRQWGERGEGEEDEAEEDGAEAVRRQWAVPAEETWERIWDLAWYSHWPQ